MSDTETHELITDQAGREASGAHRYGRYLEEFEVGAVYKHWPAKTVTEAEDHLFCLLTMNHHPLHVNDVYASQSQQGRNVVAGPFVYSLVFGMTVADVSGKAIANLATDELSHPAPVFHGDTLFAESEVLEVRPSASKPDRGVVRVHTRAFKQDGTLVAEFKRAVLVPRSPEAIEGAPRRRRARSSSADAAHQQPMWDELVRDRGGIPVASLAEAVAAKLAGARFVAVLVRDHGVLPAVARLEPAQAVAHLVLGDTGPVITRAAEANRFLGRLQASRVDPYLLKAGRVGGTGPEGSIEIRGKARGGDPQRGPRRHRRVGAGSRLRLPGGRRGARHRGPRPIPAHPSLPVRAHGAGLRVRRAGSRAEARAGGAPGGAGGPRRGDSRRRALA